MRAYIARVGPMLHPTWLDWPDMESGEGVLWIGSVRYGFGIGPIWIGLTAMDSIASNYGSALPELTS